MRDGPKREERPRQAARRITKITYEAKDSTERDLEALVLSFAAASVPGDTAAGFLPDGSIYLLERVVGGVYSEPGDVDSATLLLVDGATA